VVHFICNVLAVGAYINFFAPDFVADIVAIQNHWIYARASL
jgi:hypothetical protein